MNRNSPIGIKVLSPKMMRCSFQHTESVLETIESIRDTARNVQQTFKKTLQERPNDALIQARGYNNAISVIGSRGSGKTSIIMTLQHILRVGRDAWEQGSEKMEFQSENIIMPILVPQDFSAEQSLLSWVLVQLLEKAEEIERELSKCNACYYGPADPFRAWITPGGVQSVNDPLRECMDALTRSFELRYKSSTAGSHESDHVYYYMDEVRRDSQLVLDMLKLISMMVDYQRSRIPTREPLFFFVIDDLDLAPDRSHEVLNLVIRYLQHPNVVVLCGWNQELFQSHLTMELLKNQGVLNNLLLNTNYDYDDVFMKRQRKRIAALDSARRLSMDNLKKAFPPAQRYEIRGLSMEQRAFFPTVPSGHLAAEQTECFLPLIESTLLCCRGVAEKDCFLYNQHGEYLQVYMRIFDNKARGMINVYRAFENLRARVEEWDRQGELNVTPYMISLLDTVLFSNTHFVPYRRGLRDLISITDIVLRQDTPCTCEYYCNYQSVSSVLQDYRKAAALAEDSTFSDDRFELEREYNYFPSLIVDAYILLNFFENMMRYICRLTRFEHGGTEFSAALNEVNGPIRVSATANNLLSVVVAASGLTEVPLFPTLDDFRFNLTLLDSYEKNGFMDRQYDFSGGYSYVRLSRALLTMSQQRDTEGTCYFSEDRLEQIYKTAKDWLIKMERLFAALHFSEKNVQRLARYRCFLLQGIFERKTDLLQAIECQQKPHTPLVQLKGVGPTSIVTDVDLDNLITCLRQTDTLRSQFLNMSASGSRRSRISKADRQYTVSLATAYNRARTYVDTFSPFSEKMLEELLDITNYAQSLSKFRQQIFVSDHETDEATCEIMCKLAKEEADRNIEMLLWNLRYYLETAFHENYASIEDILVRHEFLLSASEAIAEYRQRWNLGYGTWGQAEEDAAKDLQEIFRKSGLLNAYNQTRRLSSIGPNLEDRNRNDYDNAYESASQAINQYTFNHYEEDRIRANLQVLKNAGENIRRKTMVEADIHDVLYELGVTIAEMCADIANADKLLTDKTSSERNRVSWPIITSNREAFNHWHEYALRREKKIRAKERTCHTQTKFDVISL